MTAKSDPYYAWNRWFRPRCRARGRLPEGLRRCELDWSHTGPHAADNGVYPVLWTERSWTGEAVAA